MTDSESIKPVESSRDLTLLNRLLSALVGQPFLKAKRSYGGELMLHFGGPVPYTSPKLAGEKKGAWILGTRASGWGLSLPSIPGEAGTSGSSCMFQRKGDEIDKEV